MGFNDYLADFIENTLNMFLQNFTVGVAKKSAKKWANKKCANSGTKAHTLPATCYNMYRLPPLTSPFLSNYLNLWVLYKGLALDKGGGAK